jgi:hypothetical protein
VESRRIDSICKSCQDPCQESAQDTACRTDCCKKKAFGRARMRTEVVCPPVNARPCLAISGTTVNRKGNCIALAHGSVQVCISLRKSNLRSLHRTGTNKTKEQIAWRCICVRFGACFA